LRQPTSASTATVYEDLLDALRSTASHNRSDVVAPVTILWTDKERRWDSVVSRLRAELPLLTFGPYDPEALTGPAIWLRCVLAGTLPEIELPDGVPIIYLPGVSRADLRAVEDCPKELLPLAELQYRGVLFTQKNGRDWTPAAFLQNRLGIKVGEDAATRGALTRALLKVLDEPVSSLQANAPLRAAYLNELLSPDPEREILLWLNEPSGYRSRAEAEDPGVWASFREVCTNQYGFDPITDGAITAGRLLGERGGLWDTVWRRFAEAPRRYPNLPGLLERARPPKDNLFDLSPSWPQDNREEERRLRTSLLALADELNPVEMLLSLEAEHGERRNWVWAELAQALLACALMPLSDLARAVAVPHGAGTPEELASRYISGTWKADRAALEALSSVETEKDSAAVRVAVEALYRPWLEESARHFQSAVADAPLPSPVESDHPSGPEDGVCILFTDGLRYDVARYLAELLEEKEVSVDLSWQFSALPGITRTAKPAISPVGPLLGPGNGFDAQINGSKITAESLRRLLREAGYEILKGEEIGTADEAAWTEFGDLDSIGHNRGWKLVREVWRSTRDLAGRISALLDAGWQEVRVITDHGWLLLPGKLPKVELPEHLTVIRKGRCARLKEGARTEQQTVPWSLDPQVSVAVAPGIGAYETGKEYEHGGLSLQECVVPVLTVKPIRAVEHVSAGIEGVRWTGLRCRVTVEGAPQDTTVDLRSRAADPTSSLARPKALGPEGTASLFVEDDRREDEAVLVVVLGPDGQVLAQTATIIGG
jgi:hypothetical protein